MSTEEERARLLRAIAEGGYNPYEDDDGNTACILEQWADELAPMRTQIGNERTQIGNKCGPYTAIKRLYLRLKLRAKLRWFGLVCVLWACAEVAPLARVLSAQVPADSLIMTKLVRDAIGEWHDGTYKAYCLTWVAERADRPRILFLLDAVPADTTQAPLCGSPEGAYPVFLDAPTCPPEERVSVTDRAWILIRCGQNEFARYRRAPIGKRT